MGEPSLWNSPRPDPPSAVGFVSTPHGRAVPLEQGRRVQTRCNHVEFQPLMGEPSLWNGKCAWVWGYGPSRFNPSWESRPSGTYFQIPKTDAELKVSTPHGRAVPLEPSVLNTGKETEVKFQPLMGEPSLWNSRAYILLEARIGVSTPHGRAVPLEPGRRQPDNWR